MTITFRSLDAVGVYVTPQGSIVKVQANRNKSAVYTMAWASINGERLTLSGERVKGSWLYSPSILNEISDSYRMNLEQAKQFILLYGQCARCGRGLKAEESVEQGVGPTCRKVFAGF